MGDPVFRFCHSAADRSLNRREMNSAHMLTPPPIATQAFTDAAAAVARLEEIYERNTKFLRDRLEAYINGALTSARLRAYYPFVRMTTSTHTQLDSRLAYGFVAKPGVYETSVTRPDLFRRYLTDQIRRQLITRNRRVAIVLAVISMAVAFIAAHVSAWLVSPGVM